MRCAYAYQTGKELLMQNAKMRCAWDAKMRCACAYENEKREMRIRINIEMRIPKWNAHSHTKMRRACVYQNSREFTSYFVLPRRTSFLSAQVHLILCCTGASHFGVCTNSTPDPIPTLPLTLFCVHIKHNLVRITACSRSNVENKYCFTKSFFREQIFFLIGFWAVTVL